MGMKTIHVNGKPCLLVTDKAREVTSGTIIGQRFGRRVYRVLCEDGDDFICRSVRNENILVSLSRQEVAEEFGFVEPLE